MNAVAEKAKEILTPVVESAGYEIVEVDYSKSYGEFNLTVFIFKKGGISLEDCEKVNALADEVLEQEDVTDGIAYNLNISSPGLDRLIVSDDDFRRSLDTEIEIIFLQPLGKKKKVVGELIAYDDKTATLIVKNIKTVFNRDNFKIVRPYINFKYQTGGTY